ncbi:MAG: transporter substrate-binding domain-containing protein [Oscillospiraceae bacterium]
MKNYKKVLVLGLAAVMSLGLLTACGKKPAAPVAINSAADLAGKKIAVQEGTTGDLLVSDITGTEVTRLKAATACAMELVNGKVDCVVIDKLPAQKLVDANKDKIKMLDFAASEENESYAIAVGKENTDLLDKVNAAIKTLNDNGTMEKLMAKHVNGEEVELPALGTNTANGELVMGTNAEFEPFEYVGDDGELAGFDIDFAKYIAAELGMSLKIENLDFDALIPTLQSGKVDMVAAGMTATDERKQSVNFTTDYYESTQAILVQK